MIKTMIAVEDIILWSPRFNELTSCHRILALKNICRSNNEHVLVMYVTWTQKAFIMQVLLILNFPSAQYTLKVTDDMRLIENSVVIRY